MNLADLKNPFPPERISWRVGPTTADKTSGIALAYIDARDVMQRLDEVCGDNWQCAYPHANGKTVCSIGIKVGDEWIWRANGAGDTDMEAEKGAMSDAFKRAAVCFGIGRYLYDVENIWVKIESAGKSYKIAQHEYARLQALLSKQAAPVSNGSKPSAAAIPEKYDDPDGQTKAWCDGQKLAFLEYRNGTGLEEWLQKQSDGGGWGKPKSGSNLDRLKRKYPEAFNDLQFTYQQTMGDMR